MHLYSDLAGWFHLLTAPEDYAEDAAAYARIIEAEAVGRVRTLLELGCGGGNNASHLKASFACTLTDVSPEMLAVSQGLNPECEHIVADMRMARFGRLFDAVLVHDAVMYLTTETDLRAAMATAFIHTRPGGVALFGPDCTAEKIPVGVDTGGHDGDRRSLRYLEWTHDPDPADTTYEVDFAIMVCDAEGMRVVHDHHVFGVFPLQSWLDWLAAAGFEPSLVATPSEPVLAGRRPLGGERRSKAPSESPGAP